MSVPPGLHVDVPVSRRHLPPRALHRTHARCTAGHGARLRMCVGWWARGEARGEREGGFSGSGVDIDCTASGQWTLDLAWEGLAAGAVGVAISGRGVQWLVVVNVGQRLYSGLDGGLVWLAGWLASWTHWLARWLDSLAGWTGWTGWLAGAWLQAEISGWWTLSGDLSVELVHAGWLLAAWFVLAVHSALCLSCTVW